MDDGVRPVYLPSRKLALSRRAISWSDSLEALILKGVGNVQQVYCVISFFNFFFFSQF